MSIARSWTVSRSSWPVVTFIAGLFGIRISLNPYWLHVAVVLNLYFAAHATSALRQREVARAAVFYLVWGTIVASFAAVTIGSFAFENKLDDGLSFLIAVLAVSIFALGNTVRSATLYRDPADSWWQAFMRPTRHVVRFVWIGSVFVALGFCWDAFVGWQPDVRWGLLLMYVFAIFLALYRIWVSDRWIANRPADRRSRVQAMLKTRQAHIGWGMLAGIVGAALFVAFGFGQHLLQEG